MTVSHIQRLKGFASSHPPLLVFTVCILAFGVTTIVLAFVVRESDLPNPDIVMDWNIFISHLVQNDICADIDNSTTHKIIKTVKPAPNANSTNLTMTPSEIPLGEMSLIELLPDLNIYGDKGNNPSKNITKTILVPIEYGDTIFHIPNSVKWLKGSIKGRQLGLTGKPSKESISVSFFIPAHNKKAHAAQCKKDKTDCKVVLNTCLLFFGPSALLPKTRKPQSCGKLSRYPKPINIAFQNPQNNLKCAGKTTLKLKYATRPEYTVMLSLRERSLVILHLIHTSYFLFVIVITMLCYALIRGHYRRPVVLDKVNV